MAASAADARQALISLNDLARRDLFRLWESLSGLPAPEVRDALRELLPGLVDQYGLAAGTLAADWYDVLRDDALARGSFYAEPVELPTQERYDALARWGVSPLFSSTPDASAALTLIAGGIQRDIANAHRLTIVENTVRDPAAVGWQRVGVGENCGFCNMLIDRGGVYTGSSVTFRSHDHCNCAASPTWDASLVKVSPLAYSQSQRTRSDATKARDNARAYDYIAEHY